MTTKIICPYCNKEAEFFAESSGIYGIDRGPVYTCRQCNARVMAHKNNLMPMGTLANRNLRGYRKQAHEIFDKFWHKIIKKMNWHEERARDYAYQQLALAMNLSLKDCHFALFDISACKMAIHICQEIKLPKPDKIFSQTDAQTKIKIFRAKLRDKHKKNRIKRKGKGRKHE